MKLFYFLMSFLFLACGPKDLPLIQEKKEAVSPSIDLDALSGLRIKDLFIVMFPKDYSPKEWTLIFNETKRLSKNKRRLLALEGAADEQSNVLRADLLGQNGEILTFLSQKSSYLLSWTIQDENCRIKKDLSQITCRPFNRSNPLNGGLPQSRSGITLVTPDPVRDDIKTPHIRFELEGADRTLTLRLLLEATLEREIVFKGFANETLKEGPQNFKYGYSEMTLERSN